jgi:hypothetical protein
VERWSHLRNSEELSSNASRQRCLMHNCAAPRGISEPPSSRLRTRHAVVATIGGLSVSTLPPHPRAAAGDVLTWRAASRTRSCWLASTSPDSVPHRCVVPRSPGVSCGARPQWRWWSRLTDPYLSVLRDRAINGDQSRFCSGDLGTSVTFFIRLDLILGTWSFIFSRKK